jgi:CubicO group peptidase (beta-lactamase class C family)
MTALKQATRPSAFGKALDDLFSQWNRSDAPGLAVGVSRCDTELYRRGFGMANLEMAVSITPRTRMRIASITKHMTALLALLLAEDGKFDLDIPVRAYLPELAGPGGDPTVRQLLQHTGGSRCYLDLGFLFHGTAFAPAGTALAAQSRQQDRNFAPGSGMIYNNGGYHLVSIALERITGASLHSQMTERLFRPLGLFDTLLQSSDYLVTPGMASTYVPDNSGGWRRGIYPTEESLGSGGVVSTVDDMLRWARHLQTRQLFGSAASWTALTERPKYADGTIGSYALGLVVGSYRGLPTVEHSGGWIGGTSQLLLFPEQQLEIVILINGAPEAHPVNLANRIADLVLADELGPATASLAAKDYSDLLGEWWSRDTGMLYSLLDDDGALKFSVLRYPLRYPVDIHRDGGLVSSSSGLGEVRLTPLSHDRINVRFAGEEAEYTRVRPSIVDSSEFGRQISGRYYSHDADASADIVVKNGELVMQVRDQVAGVAYRLNPIAELAAHAEQISDQNKRNALVNFTTTPSRAGFVLNGFRTRHLAFTRQGAC